ncbi:MAG TPA: hypothetical protein VEU30_00295 [Thermoanaerobaculia bacterium]|nr:hypothetical protein [Thermoanaerobaculia bacterium]
MSAAALLSEEIARLSAVAAACGANVADTHATFRRLLSDDGVLPDQRGHSVLNANGSPMELCITSTAKDLRVRCIGDPAFHFGNAFARYQSSRRVLASLPAVRRSGELESLCSRVIDLNVSSDTLDAYEDGVMWLAAGVGDEGMAVYLDAYPPGREVAWSRARQWLSAMLGDPAEMLAAVDVLSLHATLCSIGMEAATPRDARAKLHVRYERLAHFDQLGLPLLQDRGIREFVVRAVQERELPLSGVVIGVGASMVTGALRDVKVDLAGSYLNYPAEQWQELTDWCAEEIGVHAIPLGALLTECAVDVAYIGLGVDRAGAHRLNVYLKAVRP